MEAQNGLPVYGFWAASLQWIFKTTLCTIFDIPAYLGKVYLPCNPNYAKHIYCPDKKPGILYYVRDGCR